MMECWSGEERVCVFVIFASHFAVWVDDCWLQAADLSRLFEKNVDALIAAQGADTIIANVGHAAKVLVEQQLATGEGASSLRPLTLIDSLTDTVMSVLPPPAASTSAAGKTPPDRATIEAKVTAIVCDVIQLKTGSRPDVPALRAAAAASGQKSAGIDKGQIRTAATANRKGSCVIA
jgi:hypothetical protein